MAAVGAAAGAGAGTAIADTMAASAAKTATNAVNMYAKMVKVGEDNALALI